MDKKAISEIRKLIKPDSCIDRIRACYVNEEGEVIRPCSHGEGIFRKIL